MRLATYNFLHGGSSRREGHWRLLHEHATPDVVFCQEAVPHDDSVGAMFWKPVRGMKWGTGIWLRSAIGRRVTVTGFAGWVTAVRCDDLQILFVSVHCPAGTGGYVGSMHRILDALKRYTARQEIILAGDLNVAVGYRDNGDVVSMSAGERSLLDRMRIEFDLHPCWQTANPGVPLSQTLRWMRNPATPYHCDGIFASARRLQQLTSCTVLSGDMWTALSDHNPVVAQFDM